MHEDWRTWPTRMLKILVINLELELLLGASERRRAEIWNTSAEIIHHIEERSQPWTTTSPG